MNEIILKDFLDKHRDWLDIKLNDLGLTFHEDLIIANTYLNYYTGEETSIYYGILNQATYMLCRVEFTNDEKTEYKFHILQSDSEPDQARFSTFFNNLMEVSSDYIEKKNKLEILNRKL